MFELLHIPRINNRLNVIKHFKNIINYLFNKIEWNFVKR